MESNYNGRVADKVKELIHRFESKTPEIVFEWKDAETDAMGWLVINSLRGGSAGGGTRMRAGLDRQEVISLAKTMEIKFSISGPPIGGAKSGINFDPSDPRKKDVLRRWFTAVMPLLKGYYGTGGDLNVDEIHDVIPITESLGLRHPQEGTVIGYWKAGQDKTERIIKQLRTGVKKRLDDAEYSPDLGRNITVADMITGFGVAEAVRHYYDITGESIRGKRAIVQGWGNVGAAAGYYLSKSGAKIVCIQDKEGGLCNPEGFSFEEVRKLFLNRDGNKLSDPRMVPSAELEKTIWTTGAEIFVPAAASRIVKIDHIKQMASAGLEVISCGANVPFADKEIFLGPTAMFADETVSVIPDFIANCGMARVFRYLMNDPAGMSDREIFSDVTTCIREAMEGLDIRSGRKFITQRALDKTLSLLLSDKVQ